MRVDQMSVRLALFVGITLGEGHALARLDFVPGSRYTSGRQAAMGDAALSVGEDPATGLFYNPASLGKIRKTSVEPLNFTAYANSPVVERATLKSLSATSLSAVAPTLASHPGEFSGAGGALLPSFGFPGFALGILMQSEMTGKANGDGTLTYRSQYQFVPTVGTGFSLLRGMLRMGYSFQWVNQASGTATVATTADPLGFNQGLAQGSGLSHTAGLALTIPMRFLPSLNFVARNIMGTPYRSYSAYSFTNSPSGVPATEPMTFDASFSVHPLLGKGVGMELVAVNRDMTARSGGTLMGRMAFGTEISFRDRVFLRGGWGGGYLSAGLGLKRSGAEFSLAWYAEEVGTHTLDVLDRRYLLQYQLRAF